MALAQDAIVVLDREGVIVAWNDAAERFFGYPSDEVCGTPFWPMLAPGLEAEYGRFFRDLVDQRIRAPRRPTEIVSTRRDGSTFPAELSVSAWGEGRDACVLCIFRDVTERREMETQLRASTELFEGVLNGAWQSSIIATDAEGVVTVFNPGAERLSGYGAGDVIGSLNLVALHDPAEVAARAIELGVEPGLEVLVSAARRGEAETHEWTYVAKNGTRVPVSLTVTAMIRDRELQGFIAVAHNLTEQRRTERSLARANEAFRVAFSSAPTAIVLVNADVTCAHASPVFCELSGYSARELTGKSMLDLIAPDDKAADDDGEDLLAREVATYARLLAGEDTVVHAESNLLRADGSTVSVRTHTSMVTDDDGAPVLWITHLEDITQEQKIQSALREALERKIEAIDRLEEIDRAKSTFVSMVTHELRSPVTSIIGYLELLADGSYGELDEGQRKVLDTVIRNAARLEQLIADLLMLSRIETGMHAELEKRDVDMRPLLEHVAASMVPIAARRRQQFVVNIAPEIGIVAGDERQLEHIVTNLLTNALKFTPEAGTIELRADRSNKAVVITVRDTGVGIPEEDQAKVFLRFYRGRGEAATSAPGSGLGLAIVRAIVTNHGGRVSLESQLGVGTTVTVALPCVDTPRRAAALTTTAN